jgi:hypothetical protein
VQQESVPDPVHWELSNRQDPVVDPVQQESVPDPVHWEVVVVCGSRSNCTWMSEVSGMSRVDEPALQYP